MEGKRVKLVVMLDADGKTPLPDAGEAPIGSVGVIRKIHSVGSYPIGVRFEDGEPMQYFNKNELRYLNNRPVR